LNTKKEGEGMTMDTSFDDALRVLQGGRSMAMEALQQLPVTWYEVVKVRNPHHNTPSCVWFVYTHPLSARTH
jgi:hypothetical protein